jgi:hypothetical protein
MMKGTLESYVVTAKDILLMIDIKANDRHRVAHDDGGTYARKCESVKVTPSVNETADYCSLALADVVIAVSNERVHSLHQAPCAIAGAMGAVSRPFSTRT